MAGFLFCALFSRNIMCMRKATMILFFIPLVATAFALFNVQISNADHLCKEVCESDGFGGTECWLECSGTPNPFNVSVIVPDYCTIGPSATVNWEYSDPSGSPQSAYQVQINYQSAPGSPAVDSEKISCPTCQSYFGGQGAMQFDTAYRARVRTWNSLDIPSPWRKATVCIGEGCKNEKENKGGSSWKTPIHAYPDANSFNKFTWFPKRPVLNKPVQFIDKTLFDPKSKNKQWSWTFSPAGGGSGSSTAQSPVYTFDSNAIYQATERVRDNAMPSDQYCTGPTQSINIEKPDPVRRETSPR